MRFFAVFIAVCLLAALAPGRAQEVYGTIHVTVKRIDGGGQLTTTTDPEKHTSVEVTSDAGKKVLKKTTYLLGDDNVPLGAIFCDGQDTILYKAHYQRDEQGRVTEAAFTAADDTYLGKRVFIYGANGPAPTQVSDYDASGQMIVRAAPAVKAKKH